MTVEVVDLGESQVSEWGGASMPCDSRAGVRAGVHSSQQNQNILRCSGRWRFFQLDCHASTAWRRKFELFGNLIRPIFCFFFFNVVSCPIGMFLS